MQDDWGVLSRGDTLMDEARENRHKMGPGAKRSRVEKA